MFHYNFKVFYIYLIACSFLSILLCSPLKILPDMKSGSWLLGGGWNNDLWGGDLPMASWIDDITPHNPVRKFYLNTYNVLMVHLLWKSA